MENNTWEIPLEQDDPSVFTVRSIYVASTVVLGLVGNFLTIFTILSEKSLRMTSNILIASLAVADCATTSITLPSMYVKLQFPQLVVDHQWSCIGSIHLMILFKAVAIYHLELFAVNRYLLITLPRHRYNQLWGKWNTRGIMVAGIWVWSVILALLPLIGFGEVGFREVGFKEVGFKEVGCGLIFSNRLSWWYMTFLFLNIFCYLHICFLLVLKKLHDNKERNDAYKQRNTQSRGISREELIITKMVMLMFLFFVVSWLPYLAIHLLSSHLNIPALLTIFVQTFALSSSSFNAVIYAATNKHFRKRIFSKWFPFRRSANPTSVNI